MKTIYDNLIKKIENLKDLPLLAMRIILAIGFYKPAMMKLKDIDAIAQWFESMHYILPKFNAYLATFTETLGVGLLILGLGVRFISVPLLVTMLVAIATVHWGNGFEARNNGSEIPIYYMLMLITLFINGGGKLSLDHIIARKSRL
ncbi:MAG: DoxX family protein [Bacteroidetes bacterium]|jgi:putative oxidoreductase|nr:DoxX family protein [Bacteroidota bacterium]MBT5528039.1 DoxX family protein [Cytophagia bacterium]MBT3423006.1 DoxX family protein [Bacteroidota bacterium]MBT3933592.1 DoxX family protein [Bacteroidota bacterium]MBT4338835.1 DoxX family protein [Bacteroidota bacterium]